MKKDDLLNKWKGSDYILGLGILEKVGAVAASYVKKALVVSNDTYMKPKADRVVESLKKQVLSWQEEKSVLMLNQMHQQKMFTE